MLCPKEYHFLIGPINSVLLLPLAGMPQILQADAQQVWIMTIEFTDTYKKMLPRNIFVVNVQNVKEQIGSR
jgi:hypothetical protein